MDQLILEKLDKLEKLMSLQVILQKEVLNLKEASRLMEVSESHLYKLTSQRKLDFFCPGGKKIYIHRQTINEFLQRNRKPSQEQIEKMAINYTIRQINKQ